MSDHPLPFTIEGEGVRLAVRVTPRAGADRIKGVIPVANGSALQVQLASPPVDGAANKALVALLADRLHLRKSDVQLRAGEASRLKTIFLRGDADEIAARLTRFAEPAGT